MSYLSVVLLILVGLSSFTGFLIVYVQKKISYDDHKKYSFARADRYDYATFEDFKRVVDSIDWELDSFLDKYLISSDGLCTLSNTQFVFKGTTMVMENTLEYFLAVKYFEKELFPRVKQKEQGLRRVPGFFNKSFGKRPPKPQGFTELKDPCKPIKRGNYDE